MTYRELLRLYQTGQLDEKTRRQVEAEIEKQDAISEYLFDQAEVPELEELSGKQAAGTEDSFTAQIQKTVRQTLIKLGTAVGAAVLVLVLFVLFVLPGAVDRFYYDPTEELLGGPRIDTDLAVWSELFQPGSFRNHARAESLGYGRYAVSFPRSGDRKGPTDATGGMLVRNRLTLYDPNVFDHSGIAFLAGPEESLEDPEDARKWNFYDMGTTLDENGTYKVCVTLREPVDYETLDEWCTVQRLRHHRRWFKVYDGEETDGVPGLIGVAPEADWYSLRDRDRNVYPELFTDIPVEFRMDQEQAEAHFLSLLAYVGDHPAFFSGIMDGTPVFEREQLDHTANYVKEHGLWLDGFYFEGSKAEVMALEGEDMVYRIVTCPAE